MRFLPFRPRIRHPLFPELAAVRAADARGQSTSIAGTFSELTHAARQGVCVRRAVFVLTSADGFLSERDRDELWRLFQVPAYLLSLDSNGRAIAWECEAQNGLHIAAGTEKATCACGRPGAKLALESAAPVHAS
jgi:hypothetical protein